MKNTIKVYVGTCHKYGNGSLKGGWITLPMDEDELEQTLDKLHGDEEEPEYMLQDSEAPFKIGEADDIFELNELAEKIQDFDEQELYVLKAFVEDKGNKPADAVEMVRKGEYFVVEASNERELAEKIIDEVEGGVENLPREVLERYFDFDSYGRDLEFDFTKIDGGYYLQDY